MNLSRLDNYLHQESEYEKTGVLTHRRVYDLLDTLPQDKQAFLTSHPQEMKAFLQSHGIEIGDFSLWAEMTEGIIVSRQDRYHPVDAHKHDWVELAYMYSGRCRICIDGKNILLTEGQCLLINYNVVHSCDTCGENDILINFLLRRSYLNMNFFSRFSNGNFLSRFLVASLDNRNSANGYIYFRSENSRRLPMFIREFLCEYYDRGIHSRDFMDSCTTLIFLELTDIFTHDMNREKKDSRSADVLPVLRYIQENASSCTLKSTAEFFHMNPNYLSGWLHQHTGHTFKALVQEQKLLTAANLLKNTGLPVAEAARQAGYENVSFFYKKFQEKFDCLPGEYRLLEAKSDTESAEIF